MFAIVVPGKVGAMFNIDLRNAKGEPVGAFDLQKIAKMEAEDHGAKPIAPTG